MRGGLASMRRDRNMPFLKQGMVCDLDGRRGVVTGADTQLRVRFAPQTFSSCCHPTWHMTFYNSDGSIVKDYKPKIS